MKFIKLLLITGHWFRVQRFFMVALKGDHK
jgi:hypothetical protein